MDKLIVILFAIAASLFFSFLMSWPLMILWNGCLVDAVPGVKEITWLQGWGIMILTSILFKESSISFNK
jgi:uncharacterized membrane protein YdbT with pleckstrin-like domain